MRATSRNIKREYSPEFGGFQMGLHGNFFEILADAERPSNYAE